MVVRHEKTAVTRNVKLGVVVEFQASEVSL